MPTWPSASKASTTNVDQGSDKISLARADIKQNFDNVNDIIDTFNISSPSDGDVLRYSSSSGQWEQFASLDIGPQFAIIQDNGSSNAVLSGGDDYRNLTELYDTNNILSITDDASGISKINLANGNYIIESFNTYSGTDAGSPVKQNIPSGITGDFDDSAGTVSVFQESEHNRAYYFTIADNNDLMLKFTAISSGAYDIPSQNVIRITKLS